MGHGVMKHETEFFTPVKFNLCRGDAVLLKMMAMERDMSLEDFLFELLSVHCHEERQRRYAYIDNVQVSCPGCGVKQVIRPRENVDGWRCRRCMTEFKYDGERAYVERGDTQTQVS